MWGRPKSRFKDVITDPEKFRRLIGPPIPECVAKTRSFLDEHARAFIAKSPFILIASSSSRGHIDVSPKGDPAGFVQVLDDNTLAIPDRLGNRRADTFTNVLENPSVGIIFVVPGKGETLRVSGRASIVRDRSLRKSMAINGKSPQLALVVDVQEMFFHCTKSMVRSQLWNPLAWPSLEGLPSLAQTMKDAANIAMPIDELEAIVQEDARHLY